MFLLSLEAANSAEMASAVQPVCHSFIGYPQEGAVIKLQGLSHENPSCGCPCYSQ